MIEGNPTFWGEAFAYQFSASSTTQVTRVSTIGYLFKAIFQGALMLDFIGWLLGEFLLNTLLNLPLFFFFEPRREPAAVRWMADVVGTLFVGVLLGLFSVWLWGQPLLIWPAWRWANMVLSPMILAVLVVVWRSRSANVPNLELVRLGVMTFCFTLGLVTARYFLLV